MFIQDIVPVKQSWRNLKIRLPAPHPGQVIVRQQARRFNYLMAGRRWRKTTLIMSICVESALKGLEVIWGAPTYDISRIALEETRRACGGMIKFNESRMTAIFPTGGRIFFRSLDKADNVRGYTANGIAIDEAGYVDAEAWYEVLRPMLVDSNGWAWLFGTPNGHNFFWKEWEEAPKHTDSIAWQAPTLGVEITATGLVRKKHPLENANVPFSEILNLYHSMSERMFRQEILCEPARDGAGVFRYIRKLSTLLPELPIPDRQYVIGRDWARTNDASVSSVWDLLTQREVLLEVEQDLPYALQLDRLKALSERYNDALVVAEQNSLGDPLIEQAAAAGIRIMPFVTTNATKATGVDALALACERGFIGLQSDERGILEMEAFEASRTPTGLVKYAAPENMHDDIVMARLFAYSAIAESGPVILNAEPDAITIPDG